MARKITTKIFLVEITLIYSSLAMSTLIFTGVSYFIASNAETTTDGTLSELFTILIPTLLIAGLFTGYFIFKLFMKRAAQLPTLKDKLISYKKALLIRSACLEVPAMFSGVAAIINGELIFLYVPAAILFIFFALRPTAAIIISDLELHSEKALLENPNAVLFEV